MFGRHIALDGNHDQIVNKNALLLYNKNGEQYHDPEILKTVRSLVPEHILQLNEEEDYKIESLLGWFKNDFMSWTPKDPTAMYRQGLRQCTNAGSDYEGNFMEIAWNGNPQM